MKIIEVGIKFPVSDEAFHTLIDSLMPMQFELSPGGLHLYKFIKSLYKFKPMVIVETGTLRDINPKAAFSDGWSTFYLAKFAKETNSTFISIEPDGSSIELCSSFLKEYDLNVKFIQGYSPAAMFKIPDQVDFFLLDSCDGLEHGLEEFKAALEHDPIAIAMDDYETKAKLAVEYAQGRGISVNQVDRYFVFKP